MPTIKRRFDPDAISNQISGRYPLKLVRDCIRELYSLVGSSSTVTTALGGAPGTPGTGTGPATKVATREVIQWKGNGPFRVDTSVDGAWVVTTPCEISKLSLWRGVAGTSGSTVLDIKRNGITLYVVTANRPTIPYTAQRVTCELPDVVSLAAQDVVTVDCLTKEAGLPRSFALTLEAA